MKENPKHPGSVLQYSPAQLTQLVQQIKQWGKEFGFDEIAITDTRLEHAEQQLNRWLQNGFHGEMSWMERHGSKRSRPAELEPGTLSVISSRMNYLPPDSTPAEKVLSQQDKAYVSRYALGRDYHKLIRKKLQKLADKIQEQVGNFGYRVFVDSAPVMEKPLAEKSGLGWIGKHSNLINKDTGSWFFLGEIYTDLPLPVNSASENHCGTCQNCIDVCPTKAIVEPYVVDARLCISYLTIEHGTSIPEDLRPLMGNRIYGCDDCQLCCPWNRFANESKEKDFIPRHQLDNASLLSLFQWDEETFLRNTEGSAIRRIGHERWLRNIAIALGNIPASEFPTRQLSDYTDIINALNEKKTHASTLVREHIEWALKQYESIGE